MKRVRIGWGILCFVLDIALIASVCYYWTQNGSPWWCLVIASVYYFVGCYVIWKFFDDVLYEAEEREHGDIHYRPEEEY